MLGLPARFDLRDEQIERAYLSRAARAHPDASPTDGEQAAGQAMATLNDAYQALKDPETRANCLLRHLGGPSKEDENALPDGFLMEIMETREALEEAQASGDGGALASGLALARTRRDAFIAEAERMFEELGESPSPKALSAIRTRLNAWRYVERLIDQVGESGESSR